MGGGKARPVLVTADCLGWGKDMSLAATDIPVTPLSKRNSMWIEAVGRPGVPFIIQGLGGCVRLKPWISKAKDW